MSVPPTSSGNAPRPAPGAHPPTTAGVVTTAGSATTAATVPPGGRRQKRMGPAPFASFEDLSDELESPEDKNAAGSLVRLPGIREDVTPSNTPAAPIGTDQQRTSEFTYPIGISLIGACVAPASSSPSTTTIMSSQSSTRSRLQTPSTPRIDISRASSSSHHDSRDSTPERELFEGHSAANATTKLGLAFREEGALDLRSSTEELDFQDQQQQVENRKGNKAGKNRAQSPSLCLHDDPHYQQRKDSQSSEIGLLSISGRTSRLSSIGSQGSGQSRLSNASHLSVISGQSGLSRSPSPHKMLLETSFISTKPAKQAAAGATLTGAEQPQEEEEGTKVESEAVLEKVLLSRKSDPTEAVLAEGISIVQCVDSNKGFDAERKRHHHTNQVSEKPATTSAAYVKKLDNRVQNVKSDITIKVDEPSSSSSPSVTTTTTTSNNNSTTSAKIPKTIVSKSGVKYIYIPLKGPLPVDDSSAAATTSSSSISSVRTREVRSAPSAAQSSRSTASTSKDKQTSERPRVKSANPSPVPSQRKAEADEPKYIRIKLKPDYMYGSKQGSVAGTTQNQEKQKPDTLDLSSSSNNNNKEPDRKPTNLSEIVVHRDEITGSAEQPSKLPSKLHHQQHQEQAGISLSNTPIASPKLSKHNFLKDSGNVGSKTPSPSLSRKSSFASIFRSKETIISPESPTIPGCRRKNTITGILREASDSLRDRSRSRSKSRERDKTSSNLSAAPSSTESIDSKTKQKSVFSIFKPKKGDNKTKTDTDTTTSSSEVLPSIEGIAKVEFKFNETTSTSPKPDLLKYFEKPLEGDSIRIPLHSPTHYDDHGILQDLKTSSQDSQETVIEVNSTRNFETVVEVTTAPPPQASAAVASTTTAETRTNKEHNYRQDSTKRQSSTSSENVVFSTKLGNNNEVFTTKLPKDKDSKSKEKPALKLVRSSEIRTIEISGREEIVIETEPTENTNALESTVVVATVETTSQTKVVRTGSSCSVKSDKQKSLVDHPTTSIEPTTSSITSIKQHTETSSVGVKSKDSVEEKPTVVVVESVIPIMKSSMDESATTTAAAVKSKKSDKNLPDLPATNRSSTISSTADDERYYSSESERDSEIEFVRDKKDLELKLDLDYGAEPERKGLVLQQDSYEDELPYIPTTLPQEKSAAVPIVPVKQRSTFEMKTYPIERPRSTTPINPSCLEEYCEEVMGAFNSENVTKTIEKLKICLPKNHDAPDKSCKSPRGKASSATTNTTNWFEFAEKGISSGRRSSLSQGQPENDTPGPPPPPLPPKGIQKEWINFDEIPERRKPPKRIQTLPSSYFSRGYIDVPDSILPDNIVYNYVNPEECKCECHEITARERERRERVETEAVTSTEGGQELGVGEVVEEGGGDGSGAVQEDELPLLEDEPAEAEDKSGRELIDRIKLDVGISDRRSVISDSSVDLSTCVEPPEANGVDSSLKTPFTSDLGVSSNRSSIVSQDEPQSPDSGSPNAFPKTF